MTLLLSSETSAKYAKAELGLERRRVKPNLATDRDKENLANHLGDTSIV